MSFVEVFLSYSEAEAERKAIMELVKLLDEDYKNANGGIQKLKEFISGELVDGLQTLIEVLGKWCAELIDVFGGFLDTVSTYIEETEKADRDGAQLLKEALNT